jgi:hypothetical protein
MGALEGGLFAILELLVVLIELFVVMVLLVLIELLGGLLGLDELLLLLFGGEEEGLSITLFSPNFI